MTEAALGLKVDSSQVEKGAISLEKLAAAAQKTEGATRKLAQVQVNNATAALSASRAAQAQVAATLAAARASGTASKKDIAAARAAHARATADVAAKNAALAKARQSLAAATTAEKNAAAMRSVAGAAQREANALRKASRAANDNARSLKVAGAAASFARARMLALAGSVAAAFSAREILGAADAYTQLQNSLRVAGVAGEDMAGVEDRLFSAANRNGVAISAVSRLYSRSAISAGELGASQEELLQLVDGTTAALRLQGGSTEAASGALLQLAQALGGNVVRAEEFNSILDGAPTILHAAARGIDGMEGSVSKLRNAVVEGEITSQQFFRGLLVGFQQTEAQAADMDLTVGQAMTNLDSGFIRFVGALDRATGGSAALAGAINNLAGALQSASGPIETAADVIGKLDSAVSAIPGHEEGISSLFSALVRGAMRSIPPLNAVVSAMELIGSSIGSDGPGIPIELKGARGTTGPKGLSGSAGGSIDVTDRVKELARHAETYASLVRGAEQFIAAQELERDSLFMTAEAAAAMRFEQELLNRAANANISLTEGQRAALGGLASQMAEAQAEAELYRDAVSFAKDTTRGFLGDLKAGLMDGESGWDSFAKAAQNALDSISDRLLQMASDQLIEGLLGGLLGGASGGGLFSGLFAAADGAVLNRGNVTAFASGGVLNAPAVFPMANGGVGLAGEAGPEAIMPLKRGRDGRLGVAGGGGGVTVPVSINVDASGADTAALTRLSVELDRIKRELPAKIVRVVEDQQSRRRL